MNTIGMDMQQVQVNTKFLNALPSEWSKFITDVKLAKSLYTTNYDQLYAYLSQHERHANEVCINHEIYLNSLAFVANSPTLYIPSQSPQHSGEDPIECINKAMEFLSVVASRFPPSNNQLITSSNPRNQATIQNEAQEAGQISDEEQLAFLADPGISEALVAQQTISQNSALKTDDLDTYDSDCDDLSSAKAILMVNLSSCDPDVLSEVPYFDSYPNDMINQDMQEMQYSKQTHVDDFKDNEIHSDLNQRQTLIDSQMDDLIRDRNAKLAAFQQEIDTLKETLSNNIKEKESLSKTLTVFKI
ncbi:hypothetical protein Tco_1470887 [Tanacetum coccineum]